ncbi:MAG TPA: DUF4855 domain-containing protein, partial [Bacillota bacterium]|nr:DUF4855 domain-containing protein [Bacillota bacterium]
FFDSYLYLPCMTVCPSGGVLYYNSANPSIMSDWIAYEEDTFADNYNVNALNEAVGEVCDTLDLDDYKAYVYFPIFSTVYGDNGFGDVDGDGVNENFTNIEDRKKVIKWWIDHLVARYENGEYENLTLNGFYWYHEAIETGDPHEIELLNFTADYLHSLGLYFIWIPYYCASGYTDWASFGFDAVNMQPNYMFTESATEKRVYDNAELTKLLGMGVEIEIEGKAMSTTEYLERYRSYLRIGVEEGYMNSIKMYYQDAGPGVFYQAWKSEVAACRTIYDDTYLYAKRLLTPTETTLKTDTFNCESGSSVSISLEDSNGNELVSTVYISCRYGTLKSENDGTITYNAPEGFTGTETFIAKGGSTLFTNEYEITVNVG